MINPRLSVAVPLHNEEAVLPELLRRLGAVLDAIPGGPHEIVMVDDGSTDRTAELLKDAAVFDPRVVAVILSRNFGHQAALTAALDHVTGDATVLMDGDLQDRPEAIPQFLALHAEGYDVVYAKRVRRKEPWWLRLCYYVFYRLLARLSDIQLPIDAGDFGLMSQRVVSELRRMPEHHRYLRGLRSWVGFKQIGIHVERAERHAGRSKYSMSRLFRLAGDAVFAFSIVPLRFAAIVGFFAMVAAALFALYSVYAKIFLDRSPVGFTALIWIITFLSGTILVFLGVMGEYLGRVYEELKARPVYIVSSIIRRGSG
jgi:dolichol-phosphate mannosyltransferase